MDALWIVAASLALQLTAVVLALRLIRVTGVRAAWVLIAAGVLLMAVRRAITLQRILGGDASRPPDPAAEWVALAISSLMLGGIALIGPAFRAHQRSRTALALSENARRDLEAQFLQSQKMEALGRLAGGVAHDFNNLLTVILGFTDAAIRELPRDHRVGSNLREVRLAATRAADLTRRLLAFSRRQPVQLEVLDLNQVVSRDEEMLRRVLGEDIRLLTRLDTALPSVLADAGQMDHLLMNLVVNARDAMPHGGSLSVETASATRPDAEAAAGRPLPAARYVVLSVKDTGLGMDEATRARAFEPFFTTKDSGKGTGLGLSTVYGIVTQAGGFVRVRSQLGVGSTFEVFLPATAMQPSPPVPTTSAVRRGHEMTVLVVEDEPLIRDLVRKVLEQRGIRVLLAADGDEALALSQQHAGDIDLLLTDSVMARGSAPELARQLIAQRPELRVLLMSSYLPEDDAAVTGYPFLAKPFSVDALVRKVDEVMRVEVA